MDEFNLDNDQSEIKNNNIHFDELPGPQGHKDFDMSEQLERFNGGGGKPKNSINTPKFIRNDIGENLPLAEGTKSQTVRIGESGILYKAAKKTHDRIKETKELAAKAA